MIRRALLAMSIAASGAANADTLIGPNGERLPGHVVSETDGVIVFQSDFVGRVQVRADQARVERDVAGATEVVATPSVRQPKWTADLSGKFSADRGSLKTAEDKFGGTLNLVRIGDRGEWHGTFQYDYKRTAGELRDDDWSISLSKDRFLGEHRFWAARLLATSELTSEGYDQTETLSVAGGWRLWETPSRYLRIGPALGYLYATRGDDQTQGSAFGLYARAKGPLIGRTTFASELQLLDSFGDGRYGNLEFRLRQPLGERLYLALAWNYVWSDLDIESGVKSIWRWEIGWRFGPDE